MLGALPAEKESGSSYIQMHRGAQVRAAGDIIPGDGMAGRAGSNFLSSNQSE